jgi:hypothetical protein
MRTELFGASLSYCSSQNTNNFRIFCSFGPQMAMRIEFAAQIMKQIWICGFFSCSGRVSIYAPTIRCTSKLARCKYENFVWSASPNCKQIAYSFCWRERKRKYVSQWQMARLKWKWTSIATVPDLGPTTVKILTHLISRYQLPLKVTKHENFSLAFFALSEHTWVCDFKNHLQFQYLWCDLGSGKKSRIFYQMISDFEGLWFFAAYWVCGK